MISRYNWNKYSRGLGLQKLSKCCFVFKSFWEKFSGIKRVFNAWMDVATRYQSYHFSKLEWFGRVIQEFSKFFKLDMVINGTQIKQNSKFMILDKSNFKSCILRGNIWNTQIKWIILKLTRPMAMKNSWKTSVYATDIRPPTKV